MSSRRLYHDRYNNRLTRNSLTLMRSLFWLTWVSGAIIAIAGPAWAKERSAEIEPQTADTEDVATESLSAQPSLDIPQLSELEQPAKTVDEWLTQIAQASVVEITGVQVNVIETGLDVILETTGTLPTPNTSVVGNALIVDIPNAVLVLPKDEFQQANPAEGIALVTVTPRGDGIRVTIAGVDAPPTVEVITEAQGLVLSVVPGTEVVETDDDAIQIVVTATRTEEDVQNVPRSVTIIEREQIEEQARISRSLQDILGNLVPGFSPPSQSVLLNSGQNLRGRFPQVLIDGVPVISNNFSSQARDLRSIDPSAIERIEIVRGATALYGNGGTGGVINIITRRPSEDRFTSTIEVGVNASGQGDNVTLPGKSFGNFFQYGFSGTEEEVDFNFSIARNDIGTAYDAEGNPLPYGESTLTDSVELNLLGGLGVNIGETQRLQLTANYFNADDNSNLTSDPSILDIPGIQAARGIAVPEANYIGVPNPGNDNATVSLTYTNEAILGSQLQAQAYYRSSGFRGQYFDGRVFEFTDPEVVQFVYEREILGGRLQIDTPISSTLNLLWGADYSSERVSQPTNVFDVAQFDASGGRTLQVVGEIPFAYRVNNLGAFAQAQWDLSPQWILSGGARYERFGLSVDDYTVENFGFEPDRDVEGGNINFDDVVFNAGLVYQATDAINVFANFAQGFSVPDYSRALGGVPRNVAADLDITSPQKVNSYELGVRGNWEAIQLSLAGFYTESDLGLRLIPGEAGRPATVAREPQQIYGLEAALDWQLEGGWGLGGTATWTEGEFRNSEGDFAALNSLTISPLKLTAYAQHETDFGWRNRLQAIFVGSRDRGFEDDIDPIAINNYVALDFISSIPFLGGQLNLSVENLLNEQYFTVVSQYFGGFDETGNVAARGRTFRLGYSITF